MNLQGLVSVLPDTGQSPVVIGMKNNLKAPLLAVLGLASLAVAVPMGVAYAQDQGQRPPVQRDQRGQLAPPAMQREQMDMMQRMGPGGGATMAVDQQFLYILMGNRLFKVNKNTLEVVGQGMLPMGGPGGPGGFGGQEVAPPQGGAGIRRGGGGGGGGETADPHSEVPGPKK